MPGRPYQPPVHNGLDIIYIDDHLIAVNKPNGLLTVPGKGPEKQDCLISRVQIEYPEALIIHRLDMETSGLIILARNPNVHSAMSKLFAGRNIEKKYIALVEGIVEEDAGQIDLPLRCDWPNRPKQIIDHAQGKPALTYYHVLERQKEKSATRIRLEPHTGRSHQLRVHMQSLGHSILGDRLYNPDWAKQNRLMLHAWSVSFTHPISGQAINIQAPIPF